MTSLWRHPDLPWVILFLALALANVQIGGTNAVARISGLRAVTEGGTLNTDHYHEWSDDWARAPGGHYYPNKAPGGVLFGLPVFALLDYPVLWFGSGPRDSIGRAPPPAIPELALLCLFTQLLPFSLLVLALANPASLSPEGRRFFVLGALFGNTAALYLNTYFGHGLASLFFLGGFAAWLKGRYACASALLSAALLTDYGAAFVLPFFVLATLWRERSLRCLRPLLLGALPGAALFAWYHWAAFGGPFSLATFFVNPNQIEAVDGQTVSGILQLFPSPVSVGKLLFGPERGVLYTQPWTLAIFPLALARTSLPRGTGLFLAGGFTGLLWMAASFGGWHGGLALGPRYLCLIFPAAALALGLAWRDLSRPWRFLLRFGLGVSLAFRLLVFPFSVLPPVENLWAYHIYLYFHPEAGEAPLRWLAFGMAGFLSAWACTRFTKSGDAPCSGEPR